MITTIHLYQQSLALLTDLYQITMSYGYWKQGRGHVDAVELTVIADSAARMNALIAGQVDVIDRVDKKTVDLLKSAPNVSLLQSPAGWHGIMAMMIWIDWL